MLETQENKLVAQNLYFGPLKFFFSGSNVILVAKVTERSEGPTEGSEGVCYGGPGACSPGKF